MADSRLRELERVWRKEGTVEAECRYRRVMRQQTGKTFPEEGEILSGKVSELGAIRPLMDGIYVPPPECFDVTEMMVWSFVVEGAAGYVRFRVEYGDRNPDVTNNYALTGGTEPTQGRQLQITFHVAPGNWARVHLDGAPESGRVLSWHARLVTWEPEENPSLPEPWFPVGSTPG